MMRNENNHLKELLLNRRVVRNYLETNEEFPNLSDIPKLTIKIPTAGFSRGIEIISVENNQIGKVLINGNYPYALIKVKDEKFDFDKTFNCGSAKIKIKKPDWLQIT